MVGLGNREIDAQILENRADLAHSSVMGTA